MIFFLLLGIALGAISVVFILQNAMFITVTFGMWQFYGSLSFILLVALLSGVAITLLVLLPSFIRDSMYLSRVTAEKERLKEELEAVKKRLTDISSLPQTPPSDSILL